MRKVLLSGALMLIGLAAPAAPVLASAAAAAAAAPSHSAAPGIYHVPIIGMIVLPGLGSLLGGGFAPRHQRVVRQLGRLRGHQRHLQLGGVVGSSRA